MPLVHIALRAGKPEAYRQALFDGVYRALRETFNVPEDDQFMTITEHEAANFRYGATYMNIARSDDLVFIQITANNTRGLDQKKALFRRITALLGESPGLRGGRIREHRRGRQGELVLRPWTGPIRRIPVRPTRGAGPPAREMGGRGPAGRAAMGLREAVLKMYY